MASNKPSVKKTTSGNSKIKNLIVISDLHVGCTLGLMQPEFMLDNGNIIKHSKLQKKVWQMWLNFWYDWIPKVTNGEPYYIVNNGDVVDGVHHGSVTQVTQNMKDQVGMAIEILEPIVNNKLCKGYYHIRGTEAHVGKSGQAEEGVAKALGALENEDGNAARWDMFMKFHEYLLHFTHHVGTTSSASYESTAVYKELVEAYTESGRWLQEPPDAVIRSHRHRQFEIKVASKKGAGISLVTPGWQLKTPFVFKLGLGRSSQPQVGGYLLRINSEGELTTRFKVWDIERPKTEVLQ